MACPELYVVIYVVNNPCSYYIDTCSKKIQSEKIIQIKTLLRATFKNWQLQLWELAKVAREGETRRSRLNFLAVFLSFTKKAHYERSSLGC